MERSWARILHRPLPLLPRLIARLRRLRQQPRRPLARPLATAPKQRGATDSAAGPKRGGNMRETLPRKGGAAHHEPHGTSRPPLLDAQRQRNAGDGLPPGTFQHHHDRRVRRYRPAGTHQESNAHNGQPAGDPQAGAGGGGTVQGVRISEGEAWVREGAGPTLPWPGSAFWAPGAQGQRGVALLFSARAVEELEPTFLAADPHGRYISATCIFGRQTSHCHGGLRSSHPRGAPRLLYRFSYASPFFFLGTKALHVQVPAKTNLELPNAIARVKAPEESKAEHDRSASPSAGEGGGGRGVGGEGRGGRGGERE
jgi:hypothetical protein